MIEISVKIEKDIPVKEIETFQDKVVYYTAFQTRGYTISANAFPYLSGELQRQEMASKITGDDGQYNLLAGVDYAKQVWKMTNVNWTNTSTVPQWYANIYRRHQKSIVDGAMSKAIKEIK